MKDFSGCLYPFFVGLRSIPSRFWDKLDKKKLYSETLPYGHLGNTVTSLLRPHFLAARQNGQSFSCKENPR